MLRRMLVRVRACVLVAASLAGCAQKKVDQAPTDTLTRRERDSILGASSVPGAAGVRGANAAADSAAARRAREAAAAESP